MKKTFALVASITLLASPLRADLYWDPDGTVPGSSVSGNWSTTAANWSVGFDAGGNVPWTQGDNALFDIAADYTATLTEAITVGNLVVGGTNGTLTIDRTAANELALGFDSLFSVTGSRTVNLAAPVTGAFSLTKSGNGTLTLAGANTYSGGTILSSGNGSIGIAVDTVSSGGSIVSSALGTGPITANTAGHVLFASGGPRIIENPVTLNAGVTIGGSQVLTFSNSTFMVNGGNRNLTVNNTADTILASTLTDDSIARTFTKNGTGKLIMLGGETSSYLGGITVTAGTLAAGSSTPFPTGNNNQVTVNGSTLDLNGFDVTVARLGGNAAGMVLLGANTLTAGNNASSAEFSGVISGTGGYVKAGNISQVLSGTNTFSGGITITAGSLYLPTNAVTGSPIALGAGNNVITITGTGRIGANRASPSISIVTNSVILETATAGLDAANGGDFILAGNVSGPGGILRTTQGSGFTVLAGSNSFAGGVEIDARPFGMGNKNALGTGTFTIGNPTTPPGNTIELGSYNLDLLGSDAITNPVTINQNFSFGTRTAFGLELSGPTTHSAGAKTITVSGAGLFKLSGDISGDGGVMKSGVGNMVLSGNNTYLGDTVAGGGALVVNNTIGSGTGAGNVAVAFGCFLGGSGIIGGPVTVIDGGIIGGGWTAAGKLTLTNGLDLSGGATTVIWKLSAEKDDSNGTAGTDFDQIALTGGNLVMGGSATLQLVFTNAATLPDTGNAFWQANHSWKVVSLTGSAANSGNLNFSTISGTNDITAGTFSTSVDGSGSIVLSYVPAGGIKPRPLIEGNIVGAGTTNATITWSAVNGLQYQVFYNDNLNTTNWTLLGSVMATGPTASIVDSTNPVPEKRFYRVVVQ